MHEHTSMKNRWSILSVLMMMASVHLIEKKHLNPAANI